MRWLLFLVAPIFLLPTTDANAESFVMPFSGTLHLEALGGEVAGSARADFGLGTTQANFVVFLHDLAPNTSPEGEVVVGFFSVGETVHFGLRGEFNGVTAWGFSNGTDASSLKAFTDEDNSLGMGGLIIEQTGVDTWVMHLDYLHLGFDDDNDILMQIRIESSPKVRSRTAFDCRRQWSYFQAWSGSGRETQAWDRIATQSSTENPSDAQPAPKRKRGRPPIDEALKCKALQALNDGESMNAAAKIIYGKPRVSENDTKKAWKILDYYLGKHPKLLESHPNIRHHYRKLGIPRNGPKKP